MKCVVVIEKTNSDTELQTVLILKNLLHNLSAVIFSRGLLFIFPMNIHAKERSTSLPVAATAVTRVKQ